MKHVISSVHFQDVRTPYRDGYTFRPVGRMTFLQNWLWNFLRWLGAVTPNTSYRVDVKEVRFDDDDLIQAIHRQTGEVRYRCNAEPTRLVIGAETFRELMGLTAKLMDYHVLSTHVSPPQFAGLRVEIVPWMRGFVVLPD